jgi:hypothetical protein
MRHEKYKVEKEYESPYPDSIAFEKGEKVRIVDKENDEPDWPNWVWGEGQNKNKAWIPKQYLNIKGNVGILNTDYDAKELSIEIGETLTVHTILNGFGFARNAKGDTGWTPLKCLSPVN